MPEQSLFADDPIHQGVRCNLVWDPHQTDGGCHVLFVQVLRDTGYWTTLWVGNLPGVMMDFLPTFVTDIYDAYAHGKRGDVLQAAVGTYKAALAHRKAHQY